MGICYESVGVGSMNLFLVSSLHKKTNLFQNADDMIMLTSRSIGNAQVVSAQRCHVTLVNKRALEHRLG